MTERTEQQTRPATPEEDIRELYKRVAQLADRTSALLAPGWGSEAGIIPTDHPLYVGEKPAAQAEKAAPVDWQAIVKRRERELKQVGQARYRAELKVAEVRELRDRWLNMTIEPGQVRRLLDDLTAILDGSPAAHGGPSVREAAADDRRWDLERYGE